MSGLVLKPLERILLRPILARLEWMRERHLYHRALSQCIDCLRYLIEA